MKKRIDRTLFWFKDEREKLMILNNSFFGISNLLNRLLNEKYKGKKINFINLYFYTDTTYELFPDLQKNNTHFYEGHLAYYGFFNLKEFTKLNNQERDNFVWTLACENLKNASISIDNSSLFESSNYAYEKGINTNLNTDLRVLDNEVQLYDVELKASVWVRFDKDKMYSIFALEKDNSIIFEKTIDSSRNGVDFFLEIYKSIEAISNSIIIKGVKDVDYLPMEIKIDKSLVRSNSTS